MPTSRIVPIIAAVVAVATAAVGCRESPSPTSEPSAPASGAATPSVVRSPELPPVDAPRLDGASLVLVSIDTLRADHVSIHGAPFPTRTAERLARAGVVFERAVAHIPLTLPSHASMLTGLYPPRHGVRDNGGFYLDEPQVTLAERLATAGYQTAAFVGSYVLDSRWGIDQGFGVFDDRFDYSGLDSRSLGEVERPAGTVVDAALEWLRTERRDGTPFFLWVHLYDPHDPYRPPERFRATAPTPYAGEVKYADEQAGRLLDALEAEGLGGDTIVVYTSDHGEGLGDHGERTHSIFLYGATLDVPLIIAVPGGPGTPATRTLLPAGLRVDGLARLVDLVPTLLDLVGLADANDLDALDGTSLLPAVADAARRAAGTAPASGSAPSDPAGARPAGPSSADPSIAGPSSAGSPAAGDELLGPLSYAESYYPRLHFGWSELVAVQTARWKYVRAPRPELYDLVNDPGETDNVLEARPRLAAVLAAELEALSPAVARDEALTPAAIDPDAEARLRSLGYLGGGATADADGPRPDPKDRMPQLQELLRAQRLETAGELQEAAGILEGLIDVDPANPDIHFAMASVQFKLGRHDRAIAEGRRTLELRPEYPIAVYNLALSYQAAGRVDEAILGFERTLELEPDNLKALLSLGEISSQRGELEKARAYYDQAVEVAPDLIEVQVNRGNIALEQGRLDVAERSLERAVELGAESPYLHFNLALIAERRGDTARAIDEYRREVGFHAGTFKAWVNLGLLERQAGRLEDAVAAFERAASASPDDLAGPYLAAETLAGMGRLREALRWAEEAVARAPGDARALDLRDRIRRAIGRLP